MSMVRCTNSTFYAVSGGVYVGVRVLLLLPLCVFVLFLGHQRWRRRCAVAASHSDVFTSLMAALEVAWGLALLFFYCGVYSGLPLLAVVGMNLLYLNFSGQTFVHLLTCAERYLAALHPVT